MDQVAVAPPPPEVKPATNAAFRPTPPQGGAAVVAAYAITIFTSAFLLFQVQPLISKFILPWFGGSPAVWTAAMLFFQVALFGGYLYAHLASTYLKARGQFGLHIGLLAVAAALALYTQISPSASLKPQGNEASPLLLILMVLGASVGAPYFALSSTGPLLQKWFSDAFAGASPYRLFALSNVGSLLALLTYPFFFEVYWDSRQQAVMWSLGFAAFAACCGFCAWWTFRARQSPAGDRAATTAGVVETADQAPRWWLRGAWIGLPALASVMFLAVTNEVCQNVATVPLLWIIPLSLYLISFIVAFDHPRWYVRPACAAAALLLMVYISDFHGLSDRIGKAAGYLTGRGPDHSLELDTWPLQCAWFFAALLLVCLICHCELARLKPAPAGLTSFFLSMALGGALGGLFVNLVAPSVFKTFFELPLALLAAALLAGAVLVDSLIRFGLLTRVLAAGFSLICLAAIVHWQLGLGNWADPHARHETIYRGRNFFGLVSVQHRSRHDPKWEGYALRSGHIMHGRQYADPARRRDTEVAYYGKQTGCGRALEYKLQQNPSCKIGIVGLGVGTITAYARPADYVRIYEINPQIVEIAHKYFSYLADCPAPYDIVLGDARLKLEQELAVSGGKGNEFDVLCLDAFSGDAIPTHLLTTEAFAIYKRHLKADGIIAAHITNSYLDLYPVVKNLAEEHCFKLTRIYRPAEEGTLVNRTYYALLTNDDEFLRRTPETLINMPESFQRARSVPLWTDRYHSLLQVLR